MDVIAEVALYGQPSFKEWEDCFVSLLKDEEGKICILISHTGLKLQLITTTDELSTLAFDSRYAHVVPTKIGAEKKEKKEKKLPAAGPKSVSEVF